jgi:hypothetical protein
MNHARLGLGTVVKRGDGATPEIFNRVGEAIQIPEIGEENPLVDVTYSDAVAREYIGGISDGLELDMAFNYDSDDEEQQGLIDDVKAKKNTNFEISVPAATTKILTLTLTCLKWSLEPMFDKQLILHFKGKVSGGVTIADDAALLAARMAPKTSETAPATATAAA